jgi:AcrR family transcriptional regulator
MVMEKEISGRQKEIMNASIKLIAEKGIQGLTIKNLAKKIGVVESAIYRHYETKTQILIGLLDTVKGRSTPENSQTEINAIAMIRQKFQHHFRAFASFPALASVVFSEELFQNDGSLVGKVKEMMQKSIAETATIIEKGQNQGEIRADIDAELFAIIVMGTIRMSVKHWKMRDYSFDLIKKGDEFIRSIELLLRS